MGGLCPGVSWRVSAWGGLCPGGVSVQPGGGLGGWETYTDEQQIFFEKLITTVLQSKS